MYDNALGLRCSLLKYCDVCDTSLNVNNNLPTNLPIEESFTVDLVRTHTKPYKLLIQSGLVLGSIYYSLVSYQPK